MAEEDGAKCTIRIGDGPEIPFDQAGEQKLKDHFEKALGAQSRASTPRTGGIAADQLRSVIERLERLHEEKAGIASDIKDLFAEAKGNGLDVPTLRKILKLRAMDAAERDEAEHLLHTYCVALGLQPDLFETHAEGD
ncbi:MAG TPA: DUF2312 domain-containing protein [Bryobacteraceae bacterium]|jgi:uncharacterized protein (UPF0335 family)|nr:DUF2312 domain-containing protein [Bryobacteraceae bacterium]